MTFNPVWNPHYDFSDPLNKAEIAAVEQYDPHTDKADYTAGQLVPSPWGSNKVVEARHGDGADICIKEITVNPGYMLSLQRHRGRAEVWEVTAGKLTIIMDGMLSEIAAGNFITLPKGSVHCMINASDIPVSVRETQTGLCREKDNIRLLDFNGRPTYPLTSETEYNSAKLYAGIQDRLVKKFGHGRAPHKAWLS